MSQPAQNAEPPELIRGDPSVELSSNRTSLSFERTRMSADRTLMSIVRTAMSLISFGFTIHEVFRQAAETPSIKAVGTDSARTFGSALLFLGVALLVMGIAAHWRFQKELTRRRERLHGLSLLRRSIQYSVTPAFVVAGGLLLLGMAAIASIIWRSAAFN